MAWIIRTTATACAALMLHACAAMPIQGGVLSAPNEEGTRLRPWIEEDPYLRMDFENEACGSKTALSGPIAVFLLSTLFNVLRPELQRRATARADEFTKTYAVRRNFAVAPSLPACLTVERVGEPASPGGEPGPQRLLMKFDVSNLGTAMEIKPHSLRLTEPATRANGRDGKRISTLTVTLSFAAVVQGEKGPEAQALATQAFVFADVEEGTLLTGDRLGDPSPVLVPLPANAPLTVSAAVTEKGLGGQFYRDLAAALESSKDAGQGLIDAFFKAD